MGTLHNMHDYIDGEPPKFDLTGGGGDNGDMEARLARMENKVDGLDTRMTRVETKIDHIEKEVGQIKWWIVAQIIASALAVIGTGVAIQQMTVATFQAAAQSTSPQQAQQQPIIINVPSSKP